MMASFRSNLYSVSSTRERLITVRNRITTCFQHWYRNFLRSKKRKTSPDSNNNSYGAKHEYYQDWLQQKSLKDNENQFKKTLSTNFPVSQKEIKNTKNYDIIPKLVSSTLIATKSREITTITTQHSISKIINRTSDKMTIMEDTFMLIREENPDLDAEIRGILMARAQTGATIGQIKEDYRKNTGTAFPVFDHITDFLLCIPGVMAFCSERGTRIFNVQPTDKTKHIYDMVMNQRAPSERSSTPAYNNNNRHFLHPRDSGFNSVRSNAAPPAPTCWRCTNTFRPIDQGFATQPAHYQQPLHNIQEQNVPRESHDYATDKRNYYQDNCQYLINRIYNGHEQNKRNTNFTINEQNLIEDFNNLTTRVNTNNNNIASNDDVILIDERESIPFPLQPTQSETDLFKRPIGRAVRAIQTSSPSYRSSSHSNDSMFSSDPDCEARLLDFPLLGDDFFLYLARMELKCRFKKSEKVMQSGLCVSGQTIKAAITRVSRLPYDNYQNRRVIINIGSVDIMHGKTLVQIEHDYRRLINILNKRGLQPILTTLAPLANYTHDTTMKSRLERFNEFIKREGQGLVVIDIWARFVNEKKQTLFDCYQNEPRQVTGAREYYVFWNKIGRQRVLQLIESNLEY